MKTKLLFLTSTASLLCGLSSLTAQDGSAPPPPPPAPDAKHEGPGPGGPPPADPKARLDEFFKRVDTNADGKVSKEEFVANSQKEIEDRFAKVDANSDGSVERSEMEAAAQKMREGRQGGGPPGGDRPEGPRKRPEGDGEGSGFKRPEGDRPEGRGPEGFRRREGGDSAQGREGERRGGGMGMMGEMLRRMDKDGDETITKEEYLSNTESRFTEMDGNKDGKITKDEIEAVGRRLRDAIGGGGGGDRPRGDRGNREEGGPRPRPEGDKPAPDGGSKPPL